MTVTTVPSRCNGIASRLSNIGSTSAMGNTGLAPEAGVPSLALDFTTGTIDPRITFSRAYVSGTNHAGTYFDSQGVLRESKVNLWLYSNTPSNTYWECLSSATKTAGQLDPFGGTNAALLNVAAASARVDNQSAISGLTTGMTVTMSFWIKAQANGVWSVAVNDGVMRYSSVNATTEWTRVSATWTLSGTCQFVYVGHAVGTTTPNNEATIYGVQVELGSTASPYIPTTSAASAAPRFDYDPATLMPKGLLIEESRANLVTYSGDYSNGVWVATGDGGATKTPTAITSPDGTATGCKVIPADTVTAGAHGVVNGTQSVTSGTTYTASVFLKAAGSAVYALMYLAAGFPTTAISVNLLTGAVTTGTGTPLDAKSQHIGNGWWRFSFSLAANATVANSAIGVYTSANGLWANRADVALNTTDGYYIWGAQLEAGSFPTSYIPTTTAAVTRAADSASMTGTNFSNWWNATEGAFLVGYDNPNTVADCGIIGAGSNARFLNANATAQRSFDGTTMLSLTATVGGTTAHKAASAYTAGVSRSIAQNGTIATNATCAAAFTSGTQLYIGDYNGSWKINGHISRIVYWNKRLPDATLKALTA